MSSKCCSGLSVVLSAAAMPPWAWVVLLWVKELLLMRVTGFFSAHSRAAIRPDRPEPMMSVLVCIFFVFIGFMLMFLLIVYYNTG